MHHKIFRILFVLTGFLFIYFISIGANNSPIDSVKLRLQELHELEFQFEKMAKRISAIQSDLKASELVAEDTAWVNFHGRKLWPIYLSFGAESPKDRADLIEKNLNSSSFLKAALIDTLTITPISNGYKVHFKDNVFFYVSNQDAQILKRPTFKLAQEYARDLTKIVKSVTIFENKQDLLWRAAVVMGVIIGLYFLIKLINIGYRKLNIFITRLKGRVIKGYSIKGFEIVNETQVLAVILFCTKIIRLLFVLLVIYLSLPIIFSMFPWTEMYAEKLLSYVINPVTTLLISFFHFIPNLISIMVIIYIGNVVIKFLKYVANEIEEENITLKGFYPEWAKPTLNIIRFILYIVILIFIFPLLPGSDSAIFKGVSVFVGILITMGSSSAVTNAVSGLVLTYMRPFKVGDRVQIEETTGFVIEKSLLVTRIRTSKQEMITIPNSKILATNSINFSNSIEENHGLIIFQTVSIGYDVPWRKVHEALLHAAEITEGISKEPKPFVLQKSLDDFYITYELNGFITDDKTLIAVHSTLTENIQDSFRDRQIEIMSPHYRAVRKSEGDTIPVKEKNENKFAKKEVTEIIPEKDALTNPEEEPIITVKKKGEKATLFSMIEKSKEEDEESTSDLEKNNPPDKAKTKEKPKK